ncbi:hypothetical protein OAU50_07215 [Planctomycetota bacterium]|nr:hypothetical protein [Planctomycetota bacterium]
MTIHLYLGTFTRLHMQQGLVDDSATMTDAVSRWMHQLNKELPYAVDWDESPTAPFQKSEMGDATVEMMSRADDPHVQDVELWLPIDVPEPFELRLLDERIVIVGASAKLHEWTKTQTPASIFDEIRVLSRRSVDFRLPLLMENGENL